MESPVCRMENIVLTAAPSIQGPVPFRLASTHHPLPTTQRSPRPKTQLPRPFRSVFTLALLALATASFAQTPDVQVKADLLPTGFSGLNDPNSFKWYDNLGHYSTVGLSVTFEQGFHAFVSERLQTIRGNSDSEQLDEYYFEDPGIWRLGKQYLPFGRQTLMREDARAARGDTRLLWKGVPLSFAVCDNGEKGARGVVGRIGSTVGVSFAVGHDFGAEATDFTLVRRPGDSPGPGRGYQAIIGADFARRLGMYTLQAEYIALRDGDSTADKSTDVSDLNLAIQPNRYQTFILGWSREYGQGDNFFRLQTRILLTKNIWFEPMIRMKDNNFYDLGVTIHVKV